MTTKENNDHYLLGFLLDYCEEKLDPVELKAFNELLSIEPDLRYEARSGLFICQKLKQLPFIKAAPGFEIRLKNRMKSELCEQF
ncbi:MAG: hypothetical protein ACFCU6_05775 [Balneolaceae bacterium]